MTEHRTHGCAHTPTPILPLLCHWAFLLSSPCTASPTYTLKTGLEGISNSDFLSLAWFFKNKYFEQALFEFRCTEQSFGLCGRGRGWDDLGEWHWNMYIIICEANHQSRLDAWDRVLGAGALGWPWVMGWGWRGGGFRMGNTYTPMEDSCQCMAKPIQCCKVISFQLK